jgi:hypothetical protein
MSDLIPVKDHMGLLRDPETNSIINSNRSQYNNYMRLKEQKEREKKNSVNFEKELLEVKNDINEIKDLLRRILNEPK